MRDTAGSAAAPTARCKRLSTGKSHCMLSLKMLVVERRLLRFDPELLHNWPPFLCVGLLHGGERFRSLLRARQTLASELGESRPHGRIGQRLHDRHIELVNDVSWRGRTVRLIQNRSAPASLSPRTSECLPPVPGVYSWCSHSLWCCRYASATGQSVDRELTHTHPDGRIYGVRAPDRRAKTRGAMNDPG
jgi:hypothetical protein